MQVVCDIEANGLENPTKIWLIVCKDIDTGDFHIFRNLYREEEKERFLEFAKGVDLWIGHNFLGYDYPHLSRLLGFEVSDVSTQIRDTLIISKMAEFGRDGHSLEDFGLEFNFPKLQFSDFSKYSLEMEAYCVRDVEVAHRIWRKYYRFASHPDNSAGIALEHAFQLVVNRLGSNGFAFDVDRARDLLGSVQEELAVLDKQILEAFPPREVLVREFTPKATKFGTISKTSVPRSLWHNIENYKVGETYRLTKLEEFNPASHKQIVQVLNEAGWQPTSKTKTHVELEREVKRLEREKLNGNPVDEELQTLYNDLERMKKVGWKVNEENLETLPETAPTPARLLARRILLESRRRTLTEWLSLVKPDGRIHGKFYGIGAWTQRMAHQNPNTANIPNALGIDGKPKLLGAEMRSLWISPPNRLLVGCDAEAIQLRIFAHYIDDPEFTESLVRGKKEDKSDPHSLNQRILGDVCRSRAAAKRFIFALLLGAGIGKLAEILGCSKAEAEGALDRLLVRYTGFARLKETVIPADAKRGWFVGLDGRRVPIPGEDLGSRRHLCMSGYLQNGEAVVMKRACLKFEPKLDYFDSLLVNFVHDEWQVETPDNMKIALTVAEMMADSLREVGEELRLKCPMSGSYYNDDIKDYTIGTNWKLTH